MTPIDRQRVAALWSRGDQAATYVERGRALEDLIAYIFGLIPGLSVAARNTMNAFEAEEVDVAFWNEGLSDGLRQFDQVLLVECKNWSAPVGYEELAVFHSKLQRRGRSLGILIAAHGITGDPGRLTAAHSVLSAALTDGLEIVVVTRREIETFADTDEIVRALKQKRAQLVVSGTIFELP
jgi:hypothetical protein